MSKPISKCLAIGLTLAFALWLVGCGSSSGGGGTVAEEGTVTTRVANSYDEQCALCHGDGAVADVTVVHDPTSNSPQVTITSVTEDTTTVPGETRLKVAFRVVDSENAFVPIPIDDPHEVRFSIAKLVPESGTGDPSYWQNYINQTETWAAGDPGSNPAAPPVTEIQATYERGDDGIFTDESTVGGNPGDYTYITSFDMNTVTAPLAVPYDRSLTHRVGIQFPDNVDNATFDFVPDGSALASRRIAIVANCNECHVRLGLHGGDRVNLDYCVTCHNPGSKDANSGNVVDLKVMIHKIHHGAELPSVDAGGEYAIWGHNDSKHDYSTVEFPQDIRNCTKCHRNASESDNYKLVPNRDACGACHDDVDFDTGANHPPGAQPDNTQCANCHTPETGGAVTVDFPAPDGVSVTAVHVIPEQVAAAKFKYNIISVTNTAPGEFPVITFSVQDPTDPAYVEADPTTATYDIRTALPWTGRGSLNVKVGWFTTDYTNIGSTVTPAQPISINALAGAMANPDGTFTLASTVAIPAGATGSAIVFIDGHPAADFDGDGNFTDTLPVKNAFKYVSITGAAVPRREIVDVAKCDQCHQLLSLHGNNRNNVIEACVVCHNANDTDINRRPADPTTTIDGKREEAIDFKYLIHSIHSGAASEHGFRTEGIVIYGYSGSGNDFSHVRLPNGEMNLMNCQGCHKSGTNELPIDANALPTTINTGSSLADPDDDVNITPTAAACSACHDGIDAKTHMVDLGGALFDFRAFTTVTSGGGGGGGDEAALCGPGPVSAQPAGHSTRTDCCSCHSPK